MAISTFFRPRRVDLAKMFWHDSVGLSLYAPAGDDRDHALSDLLDAAPDAEAVARWLEAANEHRRGERLDAVTVSRRSSFSQ
jgi:hypothetical protein